MKPDWKDAPQWAKWIAQDQDGLWFWHEYKPSLSSVDWCSGGYILKATMQEGWENSLEERPQ